MENQSPNYTMENYTAQPSAPIPPMPPISHEPFKTEPPPQSFMPNPYYMEPPVVQPPVAQKHKEPKQRNVLAIVAIAVACAILGSITGGFLMWGILKNPLDKQPTFSADGNEPAVSESAIPNNPPTPVLPQTTSNPATGYMAPADIYAKYVDAVVGITNEDTKTNIYGQITSAASSGTGFCITQDGYIISNYHVVKDATTLTVTLHSGQEYTAELIGFDAANDVALLKIDASGLTTAPLGDSDSLKIGDQVAAIGNPLGELDFTMTVGYISAKDREVNTDGRPINMMQTDAAINSGNSGGPLFDMHGNVVGITTAKYSGSTNSGTIIEGLGFAIPINDVKAIVDDLQQYGYVTGRPYLGIQVGDIDSSYMFYYDYPSSAYVDSVLEGGCAEKAGMKKGDIITAIGDNIIESYTDLVAALKKFSAGDSTTITVYRAGQKVTLPIVLDEQKPQTQETVAEPEEETQPGFDFGFGWPFP